MNFLLSNDDGYDKVGLLALKDALLNFGDVYISAPLKQKSGASCSITFCGKDSITVIDEKTIAVDGTPADSIINGFNYFKGIKFDYVISGVNNGYNESIDILFSGTIGAALTANCLGNKVIALSCDQKETYESIKSKTYFIMNYIFNNKIMDYTRLLNVNYPAHFFNDEREVRIGKIYYYSFDEYDYNFFDKEFAYLEFEKSGYPLDYDRYLTNKGYYSITPLRNNYEDIEKEEILKELLK